MAQMVKVSAYSVGDLGSIPGSGSSPGEGNATHSSTLAWKIPQMEDPGGLQSMGLQESDMTKQLHFHFSKLLRMVITAMTLKDTYSLEGKL